MGSGARAAMGIAFLLGLSVASAAAPRKNAPAPKHDRAAPPTFPSQIVSANLPADEILLALVPPTRIRALSAFADDPQVSHVQAEAMRVTRRVRGDAERILALEPDVIFSFPFGQTETEALLRRTGVPIVHVPGAFRLEDVRANIRLLGGIVGETARAERLVETLDARIEALRGMTSDRPRPRVLLWNRGGYTAGAGTLFDELLTIAGGRNVASEAGIRGNDVFPAERLLAFDPEVILYVDYRADAKAREVGLRHELTEDPLFRPTTAVKRGRVHALPGKHVLTSSQYVAEATLEIARRVHPELVREGTP